MREKGRNTPLPHWEFICQEVASSDKLLRGDSTMFFELRFLKNLRMSSGSSMAAGKRSRRQIEAVSLLGTNSRGLASMRSAISSLQIRCILDKGMGIRGRRQRAYLESEEGAAHGPSHESDARAGQLDSMRAGRSATEKGGRCCAREEEGERCAALTIKSMI